MKLKKFMAVIISFAMLTGTLNCAYAQDNVIKNSEIQKESIENILSEDKTQNNNSEDLFSDINNIMNNINNNIEAYNNTDTLDKNELEETLHSMYGKDEDDLNTDSNDDNLSPFAISYYTGTLIPTFTYVTGVSSKGTNYLDNGAKYYIYTYSSKTTATYMAYLESIYGFSLYSKKVASDSSYVIYTFKKGSQCAIVSVNFTLKQTWVTPFTSSTSTTTTTTKATTTTTKATTTTTKATTTTTKATTTTTKATTTTTTEATTESTTSKTTESSTELTTSSTSTPKLVNGVYQISSASDLVWFANKVNSGSSSIKGELTKSINLYGIDWTPIGNTSSKYFGGEFDGNNYTISNLSLTSDNNFLGLFGYTIYAKISNVNLKNCKITYNPSNTSTSSTSYAGGICARGSNSQIKNCTVSGTISGATATGGIIGWLYSSTATVSDCNNAATVKGASMAGGIAGSLGHSNVLYCGGFVSDCQNSGNISATDSDGDVGGIVGYADSLGSISLSSNYGTITGKRTAGGICGYFTGIEVGGCSNFGNVKEGTLATGGITGYLSTTVIDCLNQGNVSNTSSQNKGVGGITGMFNSAYISYCYNTGVIDNKGDYDSPIAGSYNSASEDLLSTNIFFNAYLDSTNQYSNMHYTGAQSFSENEFNDGTVCYYINAVGTRSNFYQTLNSDKYPVLDSNHSAVYYQNNDYPFYYYNLVNGQKVTFSGLNSDNNSGNNSDNNTDTKSFTYGDATGDGIITANDAAMILQKSLNDNFITDLENSTSDYKKYLDVDGDNSITANDAALVLQKSLNYDFVFPCEG